MRKCGRVTEIAATPAAARARVAVSGLVVAATLALAAVVDVLWRLPFLRFPITEDEAGYIGVARIWDRGGSLYHDAWADRPQGLLLVFRGLLHVDGGSTTAIRAAAICAGLALLALIALIAYEVGGRRLMVTVTLLTAAFGCSPYVQSFTLSGELLASVPAAASMYCVLRYFRRERLWWLAVAGVLSGCAVMVKQSAFDAALAAVAFLVLTQRRRAITPVVTLVAAAIVPVAAAALAAHSLSDWWFAVVGYRGVDSLVTHSPLVVLSRLVFSLAAVAKGLALLVVLALRGRPKAPRLLRLWLAAALVGVIGGGDFWAHYYQQLVPPLALLAGIGLLRLVDERPRALEWGPTIVAAVLMVVVIPPAYSGSLDQRVRAVLPDDRQLTSEAAIGDYVRAHTAAADQVLVIPPLASIYYRSRRAPALRFLWGQPAAAIPAAREELVNVLETRRAALVVEYLKPNVLDATGRADAALKRNYRRVATLPTGDPSVPRAVFLRPRH